MSGLLTNKSINELNEHVDSLDGLPVSSMDPFAQVSFAYGLDPNTAIEFTFGGGTASVASDGLLDLSTAGTIGDTAYVRSKRTLQQKAGQGSVFRFSCQFAAPEQNLSQVAGAFGGAENGLFFGYDYTDSSTRFGIERLHSGVREIQTLTVSAGAGGAETATVTLDGTAFTPSLTAGSAAATAQELAEHDYGSNWAVYALDDTVVFLAAEVGNKTGSFSFSSTGTAAASFAETRAGAAATEEWIYQEDWNKDKLDGNGPSRLTLNPSKGNSYQIVFEAFGTIDYYVLNPKTGSYVLVHRYEYANRYTQPAVSNSVFSIGAAISDRGATTTKTMSVNYLAGFTAGVSKQLGASYSASAQLSSVPSGDTPVVSVRNGLIRSGTTNFNIAYPRFITFGEDGGKFVTGSLILNGTLTDPLWTTVASDSMMHVDTSASAVTGGRVIMSGVIPYTIDLFNLNIDLEVGDVLTLVAANVGGGAAPDAYATISWIEDV